MDTEVITADVTGFVLLSDGPCVSRAVGACATTTVPLLGCQHLDISITT